MKKSNRNAINGWINLNKPLNITSADAVNKVKWLLKPTKIGHAGTLDPLATGVLPLALGEGTKCINLLMDAKKTYEFAVTFGERRTTDDAEGEVVATSDTIPTAEQIQAILPRFTGEISQLPPIYSALKVDGKRAYDLARAGEEVMLQPRMVTIHKLEFLGFESANTANNLSANRAAGDASPLVGEATRLSVSEGALSRSGEGAAMVSLQTTNELRLDSTLAPNLTAPSSRPSPTRGEGALASPTEDNDAVAARLHLPLAQEKKLQEYGKLLRRDSTKAETKLWNVMRSRQLDGYKFRRQHHIGNYIADFICLERQLIVEVDGGQHSDEVDANRTAFLKGQGFQVLRFWNNEVMENIEGVVAEIQAQLEVALSYPSPMRGEGVAAATKVSNNQPSNCFTAHFRATVSKGTYIRSLGRDIAQILGSEGYISRLHRSAVGPFTDQHAISLDFLAESVHNAPPIGEISQFVLPLKTALDDIPALALTAQQLATLRHGQQITLADPYPDTPLLGAMHQGELVGLVKTVGNQVISVRLLNV